MRDTKLDKRKHRILLVINDQATIDLCRCDPKEIGLEIFCAGSISGAMDLLLEHLFDVIVVDLHLAGSKNREGFELIRIIRESKLVSKIVALIDEHDLPLANVDDAEGITAFVNKPVDREKFVSTIRKMLPGDDSSVRGFSGQMKRRLRRPVIRSLQIFLDTIVLIGSFWLAYLLRFDFRVDAEMIPAMLLQIPIALFFQFAALIFTGVYAFVWRYIGLRELKNFAAASGLSFVPLVMIRLFFPVSLQSLRIPISIIFMMTFLGFSGLIIIRISRRLVYEKFQKLRLQQAHDREAMGTGGSQLDVQRRQRVLLIGAGQAGLQAAKEIRNRGDLDLDIRGFIDDDPEKIGSVIYGIRVIGNTSDIENLVKRLEIDHVIITIAHATRLDFARIVKTCERIPVKVRIIPGLYELLDGKVEINRIRDVEIEDLLGRDKVELDQKALNEFLHNKCVMITGAGGSIGSELVRQVMKFAPTQILMVELSEFALYQIQMELCGSNTHICIPLIADISDHDRMDSIFQRYRPHLVLHAAAHKHVPLMEYNPTEAIKNNSIATWQLANMAGRYETDAFVLISTDKAVNPTSIMGASKRIAELFIQGLNSTSKTRYLAVRFGNVLGSTGSVIPLFREQIREGGPVTVTHPDMTRYFMTIPEAAQLVLQASSMGKGAEIFILDMGDPVKILDLAESMIRLSGLEPHQDIQIVFTGLRPGEKLFEELNTHEDHVNRTCHPKIFIGKIKEFESECVLEIVEKLRLLSKNGYELELREYIKSLLPEAQISQNPQSIV